MKTSITVLIFGLVLMFSMGIVLPQETDESDGMEATMRLMGNAEAELPDAVTKEIKLPDSLLEKHPDSPAIADEETGGAKGHETANLNRERREQGLDRAAEAREHAADLAGDAHDNRETRGRSEDRPDPPGPPGSPPGQN